jgi:hypothetical protein
LPKKVGQFWSRHAVLIGLLSFVERAGNETSRSRESYPRFYRKRLSKKRPSEEGPRINPTRPSLEIGCFGGDLFPPLLSPPDFQKGGVMIGMVGTLEDYEEGYLDTQETLELFAELIRTGAICRQRLSVRKTADELIAARYLTPEGKITAKGQALLLDEGREGSPCDANPELTELTEL